MICTCKYYKWNPKEAHGVMYLDNLECRFISGRYGNGPAPLGDWWAYFLHEYDLIKKPRRKRMAAFDVAFQLPMDTTGTGRTGIAIHPDGGIVGTRGCIGLQPDTYGHIMAIRNKFRAWFDNHNRLKVRIIKAEG